MASWVPEEVSPVGLCLGTRAGCSYTALGPGDNRECAFMGRAFGQTTSKLQPSTTKETSVLF